MDLKADGSVFKCTTHNDFECVTCSGNKCATFSGHLKVVFRKLDYRTHSTSRIDIKT